VCAVYDVPPPVVHILDRATFSNITEQMRSMYRDTMAPRLGLYESVLDSQLRPDFDPRGDLYAEFLMDEVLRGSFEQRARPTRR
jgi:phage portal protein BeeE